MTTKKPTKAVAEKATNAVNKATTKKPTIKQLQEQYAAAVITIENLENTLDRNKADHVREVGNLKAEIERLEKLLSTPWWKKVLGLFGN